MTHDTTQIDELRSLCESVSCATEGGVTFFWLRRLLLPEGCTPSEVDVLLCPVSRDGYDSRLYFAQQVTSRQQRNWNAQHRVLDQNWWAFSWRTQPGLRLAQMVAIHLRGLE